MQAAQTHDGPEGTDVEITVIVPVYNEEDNIAPLVSEICGSLDGMVRFEVLYVDDGSSDDTVAELEQLAEKISCLRYVVHQANFGQSAAVATGVRHARGTVMATLDGDGQNDPADIPKLLAALSRVKGTSIHNTLVVGRRRKRRDSWIKRISSRIANGVRSRLLQDGTPDTGSGLKVFSKQTFLNLPRFDHMHRFLPALVMRNGGQVISIEVNHRERRVGRSKYGLHNRLWVGIVDMLGVMWLQRRAISHAIKEETEEIDV
jgi:dolichol-phosphate mannosyltransferase